MDDRERLNRYLWKQENRRLFRSMDDVLRRIRREMIHGGIIPGSVSNMPKVPDEEL